LFRDHFLIPGQTVLHTD